MGLVGEVGSGKTTLLSLLNRFHDPPADSILLDRTPIEQIPAEQLRRQFSYVGQEPFLFSDTIAANLRLAVPEADQEELERVCRLAITFAWRYGTSDPALRGICPTRRSSRFNGSATLPILSGLG